MKSIDLISHIDDYLKVDYSNLVKREYFLDRKLVSYLSSIEGINKNRIKQLFQTNESGELWKTELKCCDCGEYETTKLSKTKLFSYIFPTAKNQQKFLCEKCVEDKIARDKKEKIEFYADSAEIINSNTDIFIEKYLDPDHSWSEKKISNYYDLKNEAYSCNKDDIIYFINNDLSYHEFLCTPFWKAISLKNMRKAGFKCKICNSLDTLNVHHRSYDKLGHELWDESDLVVLCKNCHKVVHGIN